MAGGVAYRGMRAGTMALGSGRMVAGASVVTGLGAEVSAFELSHRSLSSLSAAHPENPNLWRWNGSGGLRQGFLQSFVTFGTLKGAGRLAQGENLVVQHLLQDTGMVLGHQASGVLGLTPHPTGTLAEQFLHAEATNLQLGAGMALAHRAAPGLSSLERGLDLAIRWRGEEGTSLSTFSQGLTAEDSLFPQLAPAGPRWAGPRGFEESRPERAHASSFLSFMRNRGSEGSGEDPSLLHHGPQDLLREIRHKYKTRLSDEGLLRRIKNIMGMRDLSDQELLLIRESYLNEPTSTASGIATQLRMEIPEVMRLRYQAIKSLSYKMMEIDGMWSRLPAAQRRHLDSSVNTLPLPVRILEILDHYNIESIGDLIQREREELLHLTSLDIESLQRIEEALKSRGLRLEMSIGDWYKIDELF